MPWQCLVYGHRADPVAADHGYYDCRWCGDWEERPVVVVQFFGLTPFVRDTTRPIRDWLRSVWWSTARCAECGSLGPEWGERCDCLPF